MSTLETPVTEATENVMLPHWYKVCRIQRETKDTFSLHLDAENDWTDFRFAPGQFNMVYAFGVGEAPISISGDPGVIDKVTHTIRAIGAVTNALCKCKRGEVVGIRGPYGTAWPIKAAQGKDLVIIAGGIGMAPLRPVIYHALSHRDRFGRVVLLYGVRTPEDLLYAKEFLPPHTPPGLEASMTVDRASSMWEGRIGVVTKLIPRAGLDPSRTLAMICGPEVMMRFSVGSLKNVGVGADSIYVSMERNMKCAVGFCGHCQYGPTFVCKDGPVFRYDAIERLLGIREL